VKAAIADLADFAGLDPFFRIIERGLDGLAGPGHFFDLLAEDITVDYVVTVPGYPRRVQGAGRIRRAGPASPRRPPLRRERVLRTGQAAGDGESPGDAEQGDEGEAEEQR